MPVGALTMAGVTAGAGLLQDIWQQQMQDRQGDRQVQHSKTLMDYQAQKQMQMWERTNYEAQMKHMKNAGLNPALMYGMGGGGGQSTGNIGATAGLGHVESKAVQAMGMGLENSLIEAQRKVLESQANLNNTQAGKLGGVDTEKTGAEIDLLRQGLDNERWKYEILKLEKALLNIKTHVAGDTIQEQIDTIEYNTKIAMRQVEIMSNDATISSATVQEKIRIIENDAIYSGLRNALADANVKLTTEQQLALKETVAQGWSKISQGWTSLDNEAQKIAIEQFNAEIRAKFPTVQQVAGSMLSDAIENVVRITQRRPIGQKLK